MRPYTNDSALFGSSDDKKTIDRTLKWRQFRNRHHHPDFRNDGFAGGLHTVAAGNGPETGLEKWAKEWVIRFARSHSTTGNDH